MLGFGFTFTSDVDWRVEEKVLLYCREMEEDSSMLGLVPGCRGMNGEVRVKDCVVDAYDDDDDDSCCSFVDDDFFVFLAAWRGMNKEERAGEVPVPFVDGRVDSYDDFSGFVVDDSFVVLGLLLSELFSGLESEEGDEDERDVEHIDG